MMQLDLIRLFEGYVRNYHTFNLTIHHGKHSSTMTEIEYFSRLGSMLGYHPFYGRHLWRRKPTNGFYAKDAMTVDGSLTADLDIKG